MRNKTAIFITLALFTLLFACSGEKTPHERLAGIWDVDDKASWEYQKPGEAYVSGIAELQRDISIQFDIQEQTCRALNAFGNHLLRYRVVAEEKDKITLLIGENTFIFELKADDRLLFCSPNSGVGNCLILARGKASEETERQRMTEAESRLTAIVKMHTQNVASRIEQFLIRALFDSGVRVTDADMFQLYVAEINALEGGKPKNEGQPPEDAVELLNSMLRDFVANNNLQYARIYTRNGTVCLSSEMNAPQPSAMQRVYILNAVKTGEPGPICKYPVK